MKYDCFHCYYYIILLLLLYYYYYIITIKGQLLYILELTVGFETNISKTAERKEQNYADQIENLQGRCEQHETARSLRNNLKGKS